MIRQSRVALLALVVSPVLAQDDPEAEETLWGHSAHGEAYDSGPRQKPWRMDGIGVTPFPITSANPEVQAWFDQAIALLHGFWYYEAERSLRWCLKLDPECAMAYWAMSFMQGDPERNDEFLAEASARKDAVTPRERAFIEVTEAFSAARKVEKEDEDEAMEDAMIAFDQLLMDYPDDVEAKAMYWLNAGRAIGRKSGLARYGLEAVLDDILEVAPEHVGALHYRVHNWDGKEGRYALESCLLLGELGWNCGHLLHMPGHVLSGIGLWHEAAIAMDRATRVEKEYMFRRMIVPEDNWNYVHNLDYLCYIQEQLGMVEQALIGAEQLLLAPGPTRVHFLANMSKVPTVRALLKFERWEEVLEEGRIAWNMDDPADKAMATNARCRALIGLGRLEEAEELLEEARDKKSSKPGKPGESGEGRDAAIAGFLAEQAERQLRPLEALLLLAKGEHLDGIALLTQAAEEQEENWSNDPPHEAHFLFNVLGDAYLELGAPKLAAECYERTLETVFHDGFALAGLVVCYAATGEEDKARDAMARVRVVWSDADRPNRWLEAAEATGIDAEPWKDPLIEQRNYKTEVLDPSGPSLWIPTDAPSLSAIGTDGERVTLEDYAGMNVLLIFYLGEECVHCIEQITLAEEHIEALADLDTVVLAVSKDEVAEIATQSESLEVTLLSDPEFANARRFASYDDFEEIELHSTFLIDRKGRVHWSRIGGEPFTDFDFIEAELARINAALGEPVAESTTEAPAAAGSDAEGSGSER